MSFIALSSLLCRKMLIHLSTSPSLLLNPSSVFSISFITYVWYFLIFPISLMMFSLCSFILLSLVSLWPLLWTLYQIRCLSPFHLVLFLRFRFILLFGTYSFFPSFCLTLFACFHVLDKLVTSLTWRSGLMWDVEDGLWGSKVQYSLATRARWSRDPMWAVCAVLLWLSHAYRVRMSQDLTWLSCDVWLWLLWCIYGGLVSIPLRILIPNERELLHKFGKSKLHREVNESIIL